MSSYPVRAAKNAESKATAEHDGEIWSVDELDVLLLWDGSDAELSELAELLGRTREACRQRFHITKNNVTRVTTTTTVTRTTTTEYRGWKEGDGEE